MRFGKLFFAALISISLAYAQTPAEQTFVLSSSKLAPLETDFALQTECGKPATSQQKNEPKLVARVCAGQSTSVNWSSPTDKLAARRIYLETEVQVDNATVNEIIFLMTSFDENKVVSHVGGIYNPNVGALSLSTYIPANAKRVMLALQFNQWGEGKTTISNPRIFISEQSFAAGDMCADCKTRLDESLERVRRKFLFADRIDLAAMERNLLLSASGARNVGELDASLKEFARVLNEPHTRFLSIAEVNLVKKKMAQSQQAAQRTQATQPKPQASEQKRNTSNQADEPTTVLSTVIANNIGYVRIRGGGGADFAGRAGYARQIRSAFNRLHAMGTTRWVIDLREHGGGSTPPLIAAMRPLLGLGKIGGTVAANNSQTPWLFGIGGIESSGENEAYFRKDDSVFISACAPTALITGAQTASSAEALVVAFKARTNTRVFGEPTAGYTTSVFDPFFDDGSLLALASARLADRNGSLYAGRIEPDEMLPPLGAALPREDDAWVKVAAKWLNAKDISTPLNCQ